MRVFVDRILGRLIGASLIDNRVRKILAQDLKDEAHEAVRNPVQDEAEEARSCDRDRLQPRAGSPILYSESPKTGVGTPLPEDFNGVASPESSAQLKIEEFYDDPTLIGLIDQALVGNQELRILTENIQIASNEVLARRGAYLPFVTAGGSPGVSKVSNYTVEGAGIRDDAFRPGQFFPNPLPNYMLGFNLFWQIDVWRQLRNARDAAASGTSAALTSGTFS